MVRAYSINNVPIDSKFIRCAIGSKAANKPESNENNKQPTKLEIHLHSTESRSPKRFALFVISGDGEGDDIDDNTL